MPRRLGFVRVAALVAATQLIAAPIASVADALIAARLQPAVAHVDSPDARHAPAAHAHECGICHVIRLEFTPTRREAFRLFARADGERGDVAERDQRDDVARKAALPRAPPSRVV